MYQRKIDFLKNFVKQERFERLEKAVNERTRYITVVLEDIYQPHNASAVVRNCEIFGIQDLYVIENNYIFEPNKEIVVGSTKWINIHKFTGKDFNTPDAIKFLREKGYRIVATSPHSNDVELSDFDLTKGKIALFFGSEKPGISDYLKNHADEFLKIKMFGLTESLNLSVSVGICLHFLTLKMRTLDIPWQLTQKEKEEILFDWLKKSIKNSDLILKRFSDNE